MKAYLNKAVASGKNADLLHLDTSGSQPPGRNDRESPLRNSGPFGFILVGLSVPGMSGGPLGQKHDVFYPSHSHLHARILVNPVIAEHLVPVAAFALQPQDIAACTTIHGNITI